MAEEVKELSVFPMGEENPFGQYFTGKSYRKALSSEQVKVSNITFTPGCRNHWHIHHAETGGGQMLLVTAGRGWYQEWGKPARELKPGDVVNIPANVKPLARRRRRTAGSTYRDRGPGHQDKYRVV